MKKDTVLSIKEPTTPKDALTEVLREGAQKLLTEAIHAEVESFIEEYQELHHEQGRQRVVRNGYLPEREVQTGIGGIKVRVPRAENDIICLYTGEIVKLTFFDIHLSVEYHCCPVNLRGRAESLM